MTFNISLFIILCCVAVTISADIVDLDNSIKPPTFVSPVNTSELTGSPNSVTFIDREDLESLGIVDVTDALRLVPGMLVSETHGNKVFVEYHGGNRFRSRRTQLLFNSQAFSRPVDDEILWPRLPFNNHDLSYIEVVRGTSVVDVSPKALTSAINLVQYPVSLQADVAGYSRYASNDERDVSASMRFTINDSVNYLRFRGLDREGASRSPQSDAFLDEQYGYSILWNGELETSSGIIDWSLVGANFDFEYPTLNGLGNANNEAALEVQGVSYPFTAKEETVRFAVEHSGVYKGKTTIDWRYGLLLSQFDRDQVAQFCLPAFIYDPILAELDASDNIQIVSADFDSLIASSLISGAGQLNESLTAPLTPDQANLLDQFGSNIQSVGQAAATRTLCGNTNQDFSEKRYTALGGLTFHYDRASLSTHLNIQQFTVNSETFFGGDHDRMSIEWASDVTYHHSDSVSSHIGALTQYNSDINNAYTSLRYALNYRLSSNDHLLFKVAQSYRLPSVFETNKRLQFRVAYLNGERDYNGNSASDVLRLTVSPDLNPEKIVTREIEYTRHNRLGSVLTAKVFEEYRYQLISQPDGYVVNDLSNTGTTNIVGYEIGLRQKMPSMNNMIIGGSYAHMDTTTNQIEEESIAADWAGSLWMILPLSNASTLGIVHYRNDAIAGEDYRRTDINLNTVINVGDADVTLGMNYRHYPKRQINFSQFSVSDPLTTVYDDHETYALTLSVNY